MIKKLLFILSLLFGINVYGATQDSVKLKNLGRVDGWRENHLVGFGIVTGLAGTGDSPRNQATRQSIANFLSYFDISIPSDEINSRNVAIVSLMAQLPPITHKGDRVDVIVNSIGDARSLLGGTLLLAPLKGPDGKVYALAQGAISVGGYRYDQFGNVAQKNHPNAGMIPGGAQAEVDVLSPPLRPDGSLDYVLSEPDFVTAQRIAQSINAKFRQQVATVKDSSVIRIAQPSPTSDLAYFMATLENIEVQPETRAKVIINERTGTIVAGGNARISKVTVAHGNLKVNVKTSYFASQPTLLSRTGPNIRTVVLPDTQIDVDEESSGVVELADSSSVAELVTALSRIKVSTRDIIAILQGIKAAGALHAELILQ